MLLTDELPNDVLALKRIIVELQRSAAAELTKFNTEREQLQAQQQAAIDAAVQAAVQAAVLALLRRYYRPEHNVRLN